MAPFTDYVKPVLYNNCAGERMISYLDSVGQNFQGDLARAQALEFEYKVLNYNEAPLAPWRLSASPPTTSTAKPSEPWTRSREPPPRPIRASTLTCPQLTAAANAPPKESAMPSSPPTKPAQLVSSSPAATPK